MSIVHDENKPSYIGKSIIQMKRSSKTFDGNLFSIKGNSLVMQDDEGRNHSHTLAKNAKVTCDGTACEADELQVGSTIRVTTKQQDGGEPLAICVEALNEEKEFAQYR